MTGALDIGRWYHNSLSAPYNAVSAKTKRRGPLAEGFCGIWVETVPLVLDLGQQLEQDLGSNISGGAGWALTLRCPV